MGREEGGGGGEEEQREKWEGEGESTLIKSVVCVGTVHELKCTGTFIFIIPVSGYFILSVMLFFLFCFCFLFF